jgi:Na+-driven multidrug efflux pump
MYAVLRAVGKPKMAMLIMVGGTVINLILNPIFILVFHLGIAGSALATLISHYLTSTFALCYFIGNKRVFRLRLRYFIPRIQLLKNIVLIGAAPFLFNVTSSLTNIIFNKSIAFYGGDSAIASMGIIHTISMLILMPVAGISQGAQAIISYNYGAKKFGRVKKQP